jgi:hypothetical protein
MKLILLCIVCFLLVEAIRQTGQVKGQEVDTRDQGNASDSNYNQNKQDADQQGHNHNYDDNQHDRSNAGQTIGDQGLSEVELAKERVRLAKKQRQGTRDRGHIIASENEAKDKGNSSQDEKETFQNKRLKNASKSLMNAQQKGNAAKKSTHRQGSGGIGIEPIEGMDQQQIGFGNSLGNLAMDSNSLDTNQGTRQGRKTAAYDKSNKGKKLDHIYDNQTWNDSTLLYSGDKTYKKIKGARAKVNVGGKNRDRGQTRKLSDRNSRDARHSNVGGATSRTKNHDNSTHRKAIDRSNVSGAKRNKTKRISNKVKSQ